MRTVRCSGRPGGVVCMGGGLTAQGGGCLPATPQPVDRMTDTCKTLPCRNYVAEGDNYCETASAIRPSDIVTPMI